MSTPRRTTRRVVFAALLLLAAALTGCGPYELRGRAVSGSVSSVSIVSSDDPRLTTAATGLSDTSIVVTLDPTSLGSKSLGSTLTAPDGNFSLPISEVGAGTFEYKIGVLAQRLGYTPAQNFFMMPGSGKRLLITMTRGADRVRGPENPLDDLKRYGNPIKP